MNAPPHCGMKLWPVRSNSINLCYATLKKAGHPWTERCGQDWQILLIYKICAYFEEQFLRKYHCVYFYEKYIFFSCVGIFAILLL